MFDSGYNCRRDRLEKGGWNGDQRTCCGLTHKDVFFIEREEGIQRLPDRVKPFRKKFPTISGIVNLFLVEYLFRSCNRYKLNKVNTMYVTL